MVLRNLSLACSIADPTIGYPLLLGGAAIARAGSCLLCSSLLQELVWTTRIDCGFSLELVGYEMVEIIQKPDLSGMRFKTKGMGRAPGEETQKIFDAVQDLEVGRENGILLRGTEDEIKKSLPPKLMQAKKKFKYVLRTETEENGAALLVWRDAGIWEPRGATSSSQAEEEAEAETPARGRGRRAGS